MPKVIYTLPLVGTLDNMVFEALHSGNESPRHLSPELSEEQLAHYLSIPGFELHEEQTPVPVKNDGPVADIAPVVPVAAAPAVGGDGTLKAKAAKKPAAKAKEPKQPAHRETPAERKARLAAEADGSK